MATTANENRITSKKPRAERPLAKKSQLNVWVSKDVRIDLNTIMQLAEVDTQADAVALALKIAVNHLANQGKIRP